MPAHPPRAIAVSERLRLRWPELDDAELIAHAVAESLDHLGPWMAWATPQAALPDEQRRRRLEQQAATAAGTEYMYLLLSPEDELLGACGVHRRIGPRAVEIGYWLRPRHVGRGYVTEAVGAILATVLDLPDVDRVEIHCDEANLRSQAVPRRLGFRLDRVEDDGVHAPGEVGRGMVWVYHVYVVDRSNPSAVKFDFSTAVSGDPNFRDEGLACDTNTFASQGEQVMWSKEAYSPMRAHAFVIPNGSCGVGGQPAPGGTGGGGGALAEVVYVHGLGDRSGSDGFQSLLSPLRTSFGDSIVKDFEYYQDLSQGPGDNTCNQPGPTPPNIDANTVGLPINGSGNSTTICDSESDLGLNVIKLDQYIRDTFTNDHKKIILVGYSMGGALIRGLLAYSQATGDGALNDIDSVVTMHGVQQGSWLASLASTGSFLTGGIFDSLGNSAHLNPGRPAILGLTPQQAYVSWVNGHSGALPDIPYYNDFGDESLSVRHCFLPFNTACVSGDTHQWGDMVILPGTDNPTDTPSSGGTRFLPSGYTDHSWQFAETKRVIWDPFTDPTSISALEDLISAPQQHTNIPGAQSKVMVRDCQTGQPIQIDTELQNIISARLQGQLYVCNPANQP